MTTKTADEIVVGANGSIFRAPLDAVIPADVAIPFDAQWTEMGYASEDGLVWTDGKTIKPLRGWQSFYDLRRIITAREGKLKVVLIQWAALNIITAFSGGTIDETSPGLFEFTPPNPQDIDEFAFGVEWQDGDKNYRLVFPKAMVSENLETTIARTDMAMLPITVSLLGQEGEAPYRLQTDDPAFGDSIGS